MLVVGIRLSLSMYFNQRGGGDFQLVVRLQTSMTKNNLSNSDLTHTSHQGGAVRNAKLDSSKYKPVSEVTAVTLMFYTSNPH